MVNGELIRLLKNLEISINSVIKVCEEKQPYEKTDRDVCVDLCHSLDSLSSYIKSMLTVRELEGK